MRTNVISRARVSTFEGAQVTPASIEQQLRRTIMTCMLWENTFYEGGETVADRIAQLVPLCRPEFVAACAFEARTKMKLRHAPLLVVREMARHEKHRKLVGKLLCDIIQRPDEIAEFLAIYWKDKRQPLAYQVKKGLALAFNKFNEYQFGKYDRDGKVLLRDAMFMVHANPSAKGALKYTKIERKAKVDRTLNDRELLFKKIVDRSLEAPDTWEVGLSAGADKRATFERLMEERALGALAFLRNLRGMVEAGIPTTTLEAYGDAVKLDRVLPFRFISAANAIPQLEPMLERLMLKCITAQEKFEGPTALLIDHSSSMKGTVSGKSEITRFDAAAAIAMLFREVCSEIRVFTFSDRMIEVPARRGFAMREAIMARINPCSTYLGSAVRKVYEVFPNCQRIVVVTDEQSTDRPPAPRGRGYIINVAPHANGVGYHEWLHINGWSEAVIDFIRQYEADEGLAN